MPSERIRFRWNSEKAVEAITWVANEQPGIDFLHLVKVIYFAEQAHLRRFGRPIVGDTYIKMTHGPVGTVVYDLLKRSHFLAPLDVEAVAGAIEVKTATVPQVYPRRPARAQLFSRSDLACLREALATFGRMPFVELSDRSHSEPAWIAAPMNGEMAYDLIIDTSDPEFAALVAQLRETAETIVL